METITLETVKNNPNTYYADEENTLIVYLPEGYDKFVEGHAGIYAAPYGDGNLLLELVLPDDEEVETFLDSSHEEVQEHLGMALFNGYFTEADPLTVAEFNDKASKVVRAFELQQDSNKVALDKDGGAIYYDKLEGVYKYLRADTYVDNFKAVPETWKELGLDPETFMTIFLARNGATTVLTWDEVYERFGERPEGGVRSVQEVINGWDNTDVYLTSHKKGNLHFAMPREDGKKVLDFMLVSHLTSNRKSALIISFLGKSDKLDEPGALEDMYMNLHDLLDSEEELTKFIKAADAEFAPYYWVDKKGYPVDAPTLLGRSSD